MFFLKNGYDGVIMPESVWAERSNELHLDDFLQAAGKTESRLILR